MSTESPLASSEWAGLVASMRFAPQDDLARLVAADWLQDTGKPELEAWAEFVRLQVEASRVRRLHVYGDSCDCTGCRAERRTTGLFDRWGYHWLWHVYPGEPRVKLKPVGVSNYHRGFLSIVLGKIERYRIHKVPKAVAELFDRHPLPTASIELHYGDLPAGRTWLMWELVVGLGIREGGRVGVSGLVRTPVQREGRRNWISAHRVTDRPASVTRMIRGSVRDVLAKREWCNDPVASPPPFPPTMPFDTGQLGGSIR